MKGCEVCVQQVHAKWHACARGSINPIALIQFIEDWRKHAPAVCDSIVGYIYAVTGMDIEKMEAMIAAEQIADRSQEKPEPTKR